jgi:hypothetical protein
MKAEPSGAHECVTANAARTFISTSKCAETAAEDYLCATRTASGGVFAQASPLRPSRWPTSNSGLM